MSDSNKHFKIMETFEPKPQPKQRFAKPGEYPELAEGTIVKALDRENFGYVERDQGSNADVRFIGNGGIRTLEMNKKDLVFQNGSQIIKPSSYELIAMPKIKSLKQMISEHKELRPVLINGILRLGETCNIIAATKVGKSWMCDGLALSIATGSEWIGRYGTLKGKVLIIDNELYPEDITFRLKMVARKMGIGESAVDTKIDVLSLRGNLVDLVQLENIVETIPKNEYVLIIVDAWYRMFPPGVSENDNAQMASLFNRIDKYAAQTGAAWALVHHASKGDQSGKRTTDVGSGAGSQARAADTHLILRDHEEEGHAVVNAALRSFPPLEPIVLKWEFPLWHPVDDLDPSALAKPRKKDDSADSIRVLGVLKSKFGRMSTHAIHEATGINKKRLKRILESLLGRGEVTREEYKHNSQDCEGWLSKTDDEIESEK
jgi:hypothetical protein